MWILTQTALLIAYLMAGPGLWLLMSYGAVWGTRRMRQLRVSRRRALKSPPPVSILIPAKDERERIADCLRSALGQDYTDFEVIAVNDRSGDGTGQVMDELAAADPRLQVVHLTAADLAEGWTGKCNAMRHAVERVEPRRRAGGWLLLVDSDVILQEQALSAAMSVAARRDYALLSLFPRLECHTFWERLAVPLAGAALSILHLVARTNDDRAATAFANGQFMLIRRDAYDAIGGHSAVRDQFCEDIEIARRIKQHGFSARICMGADLAAVRMYNSLKSIRRGWARIFYAAGRGRPWRSMIGIGILTLGGWSAYAALIWGIVQLARSADTMGALWLSAALVHLGLMTGLLAAAYHSTGNPRRTAIWFPIGSLLLGGIFLDAIKLCFTGRLEWRGTRYSGRQRYASG